MGEKFLCSVLDPCDGGKIPVQCVGALCLRRNSCAVCWSLAMVEKFLCSVLEPCYGEKFLCSMLEPCDGGEILAQCVGAL